MKQLVAVAALALAACVPSLPARLDANTFHAVQIPGSSQVYYLVETLTHTCALSIGGSVIAADCAQMARGVPAMRPYINWLPTTTPPPAT